MQRVNLPKLLKSLSAVGFVLVCAASSVSAQEPIGPGIRDDGWVSGITGAAFGSQTQANATFAVEYGDDIDSHAQAYLTLSYFENLITQDLRDDLAQLSANLTATTGIPWDLHGSDRGVTLVAGARYLPVSSGLIRPYVGGGAGVINLDRTIADLRVGEVTTAVLTEFGVGSLSLSTKAITRPVVEGAAGVAFYSGPVYVDVGYRYKRAYRINSTQLSFSQGLVGIGYRW
jgi:Outer membrane protein beta-barrel domain